MSIKDELIRESLIHICDPSVLISDFWKEILTSITLLFQYIIYIMYDLTTLKRAIALMQQRFGDLVINQSPIIRCIMELIQLCESQSSKSTNKTITWSFTDWWGMEILEHSIINIAFNRIDNVNYNFCLPFEADIVVYNVYTYYHKLYSSAVTRIFWTNEHDFVDINYASLSLAPSNVFDISPHARYPGWYSCLPISNYSFYHKKFSSINIEQESQSKSWDEQILNDREYDVSIIISNPVANRIQFVELLEKHGLRLTKLVELLIGRSRINRQYCSHQNSIFVLRIL